MARELKVGDKVTIISNMILSNYGSNVIHLPYKSFGHYQGSYKDIITVKEIGKHNDQNKTVVYGIYNNNIECCFNIKALELYNETIQYEIY